MINRFSSILVFAVLLFILAVPAEASVYTQSGVNQLNYNIGVITAGARVYYAENEYWPSSIGDLLDDGWIPRNLQNPLTGEPMDYGASDCQTDDLLITNSEGIPYLNCLSPSGSSTEIDLTESDCGQLGHVGADLILYNYQVRVHNSFKAYWGEFDSLPESIADMQDAGFWPFDGNELNPLTLEPINFYNAAPGDLNFVFEADRVSCGFIFTDGSVGAASLNLETAYNMI